jgi:hypothetical protein
MSKNAKAAPKYVTFHGNFQVIRLRKCGYCKKMGIKCDSRGPCGPCAEYHAKYPLAKKQVCKPIEVALHESDFKALGMGNPDSVLHNAAMPPWGQSVVGHGRLQLVTDFISTRVASQKGMWRVKDKSVNSSKVVILDHSPTEADRKKFACNNLESHDGLNVDDAEALADEEESEAETGAEQHKKEQKDIKMSGVHLHSSRVKKTHDDADDSDYQDDLYGA